MGPKISKSVGAKVRFWNSGFMRVQISIEVAEFDFGGASVTEYKVSPLPRLLLTRLGRAVGRP